jgi:hypothetical protein
MDWSIGQLREKSVKHSISPSLTRGCADCQRLDFGDAKWQLSGIPRFGGAVYMMEKGGQMGRF